MRKLRLSDILIKLNMLEEEELNHVLEKQDENISDRGLGELLIAERKLTAKQLIPVFEYLYEVPYMNLAECTIDNSTVELIKEEEARQYKMIPIGTDGDKLMVVMSDPMDIMARDILKRKTGYNLEIYWGFWREIEMTISAKFTSDSEAAQAVEEIMAQEVDEADDEQENEEVRNAPVVRLINSILEQAIRSKASDIHIEPLEKQVNVRARIDGDLKMLMNTPKSSHAAIVARIKILSGLDIAEKRIPQDGRIQWKVLNKAIDLRVSILPSIYGEKIVMRVLDRASVLLTKTQLGFTEYNDRMFDQILKAPEGIVLLSGPTGSGKTTTLYTALSEINKPTLNIITIEDPVEYRLDGINQVQVNTKAGLTFAAGLRSVLRQDPDVVMVGEIRDAETAQIAVRAAITGHLVLSTIHTNDTVSTVMRLADMGIEIYLIATALNGVVAQRLVKRVCENCKMKRETSAEEMAALRVDEPVMIHEGEGCNVCGGTGYKGRIAIHEILVLDRELRKMITQGATADQIKERAKEKGLKTLRESCRELVLQGTTSVAEMLRVSYSVDEE